MRGKKEPMKEQVDDMSQIGITIGNEMMKEKQINNMSQIDMIRNSQGP